MFLEKKILDRHSDNWGVTASCWDIRDPFKTYRIHPAVAMRGILFFSLIKRYLNVTHPLLLHIFTVNAVFLFGGSP